MLGVMVGLIQEQICDEVRKAGVYSILADIYSLLADIYSILAEPSVYG